MKIFRRAVGYIAFDRKRDEEILEDLKAEPVDEKQRRYKSNWLWHVTRMNNNRMPKFCWITEQMDEDDLKDLCRDYETIPKQVYQGLTGDRWWWWDCLEENGRVWRDWGIGEIPEYCRCLWTPTLRLRANIWRPSLVWN